MAFPVVACTTAFGTAVEILRMEAEHPPGPGPDRAGGQGRVLLGRRPHRAGAERVDLHPEPVVGRRHRPGRLPAGEPQPTDLLAAAARHRRRLRHVRVHRPHPGIALVCPFFTVPSWQQQEAGCAATPPAGEISSMPTPDVASITDPAGVVGSLEASGGSGPVTGSLIFPQVEPAVTDGSASTWPRSRARSRSRPFAPRSSPTSTCGSSPSPRVSPCVPEGPTPRPPSSPRRSSRTTLPPATTAPTTATTTAHTAPTTPPTTPPTTARPTSG